MASTSLRYAGGLSSSRTLSHALPWQRAVRAASDHLLLLGAGLAFLISTSALLAPQVSATIQHFQSPRNANVAPAATLTPDQLQTVFAYARGMQPDDSLVQVRAGVFAKRSNVMGVAIEGRRVYYDVLPDQSFGPLRTGQLREIDVRVLAQQSMGGNLVVIYQPK